MDIIFGLNLQRRSKRERTTPGGSQDGAAKIGGKGSDNSKLRGGVKTAKMGVITTKMG